MKYCYYYALVFYLFISIGCLSARNIHFDYFNVSQGLSQNSVTALAQDDLGRIWIGTRDGLNLYDGNRVDIYRQIKADSTSLLGHFVLDIKIYDKTLWVVTKSGLSELDIETLKFKSYPIDGGLTSIQFNEKIYVGTKTGLFELNKESRVFERSSILIDESAKISNFKVDNQKTLWIATDKGLFAHFETGITLKILSENCTVTFIDSQQRIWIGTAEKGLFILNNQREVYKHISAENNLLSNNFIRAIEEDERGNIWVGTFKGLSIIEGETFASTNFTNEDLSGRGLSNNSIYSLLRDRQNGMWIGTFFGGISYYNNSLFHQYQVSTDGSNGISFGVIGKMLEDNKSNIWIATEGGGLNYLDRTTNKFCHFKSIDNNITFSNSNVRSLFLKDNKTLLIGTHLGGLNILDLPSGTVSQFMYNQKDSLSIPSNIVQDILPYGDYFLLATSAGVVKYNSIENTFSPFFQDDDSKPMLGLVNCLLEDSFGILWIGTEDYGLFAYNKKTGELKRYTSALDSSKTIGDNNISCLFEDHLFRLWIGTSGGGLNRYNRAEDQFYNYNITTHKLSSNFILGIKSSNYGGIWITTSKGLTLLDIDKNEVTNYSHENGFPIEELNKGALCLTNDGVLFVGGIHGLVWFKEGEILNQKQYHKIFFSALSVNNTDVTPNDKTNILEKAMAFTPKIELKPNQNVFTISFSACNYIKTLKNTYRYKLENFDVDWVSAGDRTSVTYTNLSPGNYVLIVQGISRDEKNITGEARLKIRVLSPIYQTWYAFILYLIIIILIFLWIKRMYRKKIMLENRIRIEQREKNQIIKLNQLKLDFFTNVSHEFRTPLTLIASTLESILENPKTMKINQEKIIGTHNNVLRLNNLVTELLDFRKFELGFQVLKVHQINLSVFLEEVYLSFANYAQRHKIEFRYEIQKEIWLWFDKEQMEKVFYNLISNAFKFVDDVSGKVMVDVKEYSSYVEIYIIDNGIGISKDKTMHIFDPYYQIDNIEVIPKRKGTGIGLALCKKILIEHKGDISVDSDEDGTIFKLRLLKGNSHYSEKNLLSIDSSPQSSSIKKIRDTEVMLNANTNSESQVEFQGITILVVEDNTEARCLLKNIFETSYKVIEAVDGEDGLQKAIDNQPDIIISDVMMPKITGTKLCSMLKRNILTCHIPILLLTAKASEEFEIEGLETGADGYITKPFTNKLLRATVKNIINNRLIIKEKFKKESISDPSTLATSKLDSQFLQQVHEIIDRHIDNTGFMTKDLADELGISRSKLFDKMKGVSGLTPNDYILKIRLDRATDLLLNNTKNLSISEIAFSVGFSTPSYFSKCFKQYYGITPTKYVNKNND